MLAKETAVADTLALRRLYTEQVEAFSQDEFVPKQVADVTALKPPSWTGSVVADVGCGFFARALSDARGGRTRVIDMDPGFVEASRGLSVYAVIGDALPPINGDEQVAYFDLILHPLAGASESKARVPPVNALSAWRSRADTVFVNEYLYGSFVRTVS